MRHGKWNSKRFTKPALTLNDTSTTVADGDVLGQIAFTNEDDDGTIDIIAYDFNQDGEWDKFKEVS